MVQLYANNAATTLAAPCSAVATEITVADGATLPSPGAGDWFLLTIYQLAGAQEVNHEILKVTARAGNVLTVARAFEDAARFPARSYTTGDFAELRATAGSMGLASKISFVPAGALAATDAQAAIAELDAEKQPRDATLTAFAGVTVGADQLVYATGAAAFATTDLTAAGRALLDDANAAAQRATLGLDQVDNTPLASAPVSVAQALADAAVLSAAATDATTKANAAKAYADGLVAGLLDDRGSYNASSNVFPSTGGSGAAGAVLKGDFWYVSGPGALGGVAVNIGDNFRALTDTPGQTAANWSILEANIGFVPYNATNPAGYTANASDADLRDRSTHTGTQAASTIVESGTQVFVTPAEKTAVTHANRAALDLVSGTNTGDLVSGTTIKTINGASILGSGDMVVGGASPSFSPKTAAYTVVAGDSGNIISCSGGSYTVSLTAAAPLGTFKCWVWNASNTVADTITIDPNASETIDGVATIALRIGEGVEIVCNGTNWQTGAKKYMRAYAENIPMASARPTASGNTSVAIGSGALASNISSMAFGNTAFCSGLAALSMGLSTSAGSSYSSAIGNNSGGTASTTVSGAGAMALGGSYASGTDSFAAAVANNTSSYGAQGADSIAMGMQNKASGVKSSAIGGASNIASGDGSMVFGGYGCTASSIYSYAAGNQALSNRIGKWSFAASCFAAQGDSQSARMLIQKATTDATPTVLTADQSSVSAVNQVVLPNSSVYRFRAEITGMQQAAGGAGAAAYLITGLIRRGANAASTTLLASALTVDYESDAAWNVAASADTTYGGLTITVTGAAATNIRWLAVVDTVELTYA